MSLLREPSHFLSMALNKYFRRLKRMDGLIHHKATGNSHAFADRLGISTTSLQEYLQALRDLGGKIGYCRRRQTYYYLDDRRLFLGYQGGGENA